MKLRALALGALLWTGSVPAALAQPDPVSATRAQVIVTRDGLAYVGQSGGLVIRDVTDPLKPRDLGWLPLPGAVLDITLEGPLALLAAGTRGLVIADLSDPAEPRELARLDTDGKAKRVLWRGEHAYLADGSGGLLVVNLSVLDDPRIVARISTQGDVRAAAMRGEFLAIAEAHGGARVFSLQRADNPREWRTLETDFAARDVCWLGDQLFVAAGREGTAIYRPETGTRPVSVVPPLRSAQHVGCGDGLVAVSSLGSALQILEVDEDGGVTERSRVRVHRTAPIGRVGFDGPLLWVAVDIAGMGLLDLTDPGAPIHVLPRRREFKVKF